VQKKLGCERAALGSLSEAATVFDPERLVEIIQELNGQLTPTHGGKDPRLANLPVANLPGTLTLVDATTIPCDWSSSRFGSKPREGNTREDHRVSIAMASCELRQICTHSSDAAEPSRASIHESDK